MAENNFPPCMIYIDKEGRWFHQGAEMIHREFIRLFYQHMEVTPDGRYIINWRGECCQVEVEDAPYVIRRVVLREAGENKETCIVLYLNDDSREDLDPSGLYVGNKNVLYCMVRYGFFPARFDRAAYYQLAQHLEEEDGRFYLPLNGGKYFISEKLSSGNH
jgi:uncharacterized protein